MESNWEVLLIRECLDILIGDTKVEIGSPWEYTPNEYSMPYLTGPQICTLGNMFGLEISYSSPQQSRWSYMHDVLNYCISNKRVQYLLKHLFKLDRFRRMLAELDSPEEVKNRYELIVSKVIDKINAILIYNKYKLNFSNGYFEITKDGQLPEIETPEIKKINYDYIKDISIRANCDINNSNYDSALTKSRTLLEEVFCYIIEGRGEAPSSKGDFGKLYNQVKNLLNMHQKKEADKRINNLLSGLEKILSSIGHMRNQASDSHGTGSKRYTIDEHHARLCVNSAITFAEFIISVDLKEK